MSKLDVVNELHKQVRKKFPRRRVIQKGIDDTWQIDLVEMIPYAKFNKQYKYLLTVIDIFSKYAFAMPVKSKSGTDVTDAMKKIFSNSKRVPKNIHSDQGKEFFNSKFKELMNKNKINHYHTFTDLKASICERFNRTLKNKMWKMFSFNGNYKWITFLDKLVEKYNNTRHSTIKEKPVNVTSKNEKHLLKTVYNHPKIFLNGKFNINDFVRITKYKGVFAKGYEPNWSTEIFKIYKIRNTNPVTYLLKDFDDEINCKKLNIVMPI